MSEPVVEIAGLQPEDPPQDVDQDMDLADDYIEGDVLGEDE